MMWLSANNISETVATRHPFDAMGRKLTTPCAASQTRQRLESSHSEKLQRRWRKITASDMLDTRCVSWDPKRRR